MTEKPEHLGPTLEPIQHVPTIRVISMGDSVWPRNDAVLGTADPETCEHWSGWCHHSTGEEDPYGPDQSGCHDCGSVWPFTTCGLTDEETAAKLEELG